MTTAAPTTAPDQSLARFLGETQAQEQGSRRFENESARMLRIDVAGSVWLKPGAAIAYRGDIRFERRPTLGATSPGDATLREAAPLVCAVGSGRLYCGHHGAHVQVIALAGERLVVSWAGLLAFDASLAFTLRLVAHGVGIAAGGLVAIELSGHGAVAILTHGRPLTLPIRPGSPLSTSPHATLAWSAALSPTLKTDVSWRTALGHGGGEPVQMHFEGDGFVVVQPHKDASRVHLDAPSFRRAASLVTG